MNDRMPPQPRAAMLAAGTALTPFHPLTGAALIMTGPQTFHIQPDQLPKVLTGLDEVHAKYQFARDEALRLSGVAAPFKDDATIDVIKRICARAQGGEGNLFEFAQSLMDWVDAFKDAVRRAIEDYQRIDEESSMA
ncbi:hypothetical protein ABT324_25185 [Saccharopolyspora sp. NPDC000359]|uniref:hypothetical protein n=1 Tax=Saccharopolyspora sp. NPDC000359 TaxID=3154251 RepID=UPI00331F992F